MRFMINERGTEAKPKKLMAILDMTSLRIIKEVQKLTNYMVA